VSALPDTGAWRGAARRHGELFAPLDAGARIGLVARAEPSTMLLWEAADAGVEARMAPFVGYGVCGADMLFSADAEALERIGAAVGGELFPVLRAEIRRGALVCYLLRRRCELEERGFDELLEALGFAFMGACR
jgi:hypothetical protein